MTPFPTLRAAIDWWFHSRCNAPCSVLIDFTDVGLGFQRREIHRERSGWVIGFPSGVTR